MPAPLYSPVIVDLLVTVNAGTSVEILDTAADSHANAVICSVQLPASTLFTDTSSGVFEFWEPSSANGTLVAKVADGLNAVTQAHPDLASGLQACLTGAMNAENAPIYVDYPEDYHSLDSIGRLALGYAAHNLFGHVAATAAITNDDDIMAHINGVAPTGADLGKELEDAILALSQTNASTIANVVIGQDARRARDEDNNEYSPDVHRALRFVGGDKIYVAVNMTNWSSSTGSNQAYSGNGFSAQVFYFEITLTAPAAGGGGESKV
jgi:hypothetical protein